MWSCKYLNVGRAGLEPAILCPQKHTCLPEFWDSIVSDYKSLIKLLLSLPPHEIDSIKAICCTPLLKLTVFGSSIRGYSYSVYVCASFSRAALTQTLLLHRCLWAPHEPLLPRNLLAARRTYYKFIGRRYCLGHLLTFVNISNKNMATNFKRFVSDHWGTDGTRTHNLKNWNLTLKNE